MKRMQVFFGRRRMTVLVALAVLALAAAAVVGSGASFTATTANPGNVFTAGTLSVSNSLDGQAIVQMQVPRMRPGQVVSGSVTLANTGDVPGRFTLDKVVGAQTRGLGDKLQLVITDHATGTVLESGALAAAMATEDLGVWAPGASHQYDFTVTWVDSGVGADNPYMGGTATVDFTWTAEASSSIN
jgi:hypothetical protein